ncbi:MAG TPA: FAD:protein FMN transferase [Dehalococcoidia bacterium]|nr:FAD:protein FMN transferase [Dehalococcoidia bacterium]
MDRRTFITLLAASPLAACARPDHTTIRGLTMGTFYAVQLAARIDDAVRARLKDLIEAELAAINRAMSTYDPRSELSAFNRREDLHWMPASRGLIEVIDSASRISTATQGALDVTVGPLVDLWGFGPQYDVRRVPDDAAIERVRESVGYRHVQTDLSAGAIRKRHGRTRVDLSAIAKGYGVDRVAMILDREGVHDYLVEIAGEIRAKGATAAGIPWRIGIERPVDGGHVIGEIVALENRGISTSGSTQNFFEQDGRHYSHVIDPRTARPVGHPPIAVSVVAGTTMEADAWATSLVVLGPERGYALAQARGLAALFVTASGATTFDVHATDAFRAYLVG